MSFILIVSLLGIWLFFSRVLTVCAYRVSATEHDVLHISSVAKHPLLSWLLTMAFMGGLSNIFYYLDSPHTYACTIIIAIGMICIAVFSKDLIKAVTRLPEVILKTADTCRHNILLFSCIFLLIFLYTIRAGAPWYDQDEIAYYGYLTKLIANGWTYSDLAQLDLDKRRLPVLGEAMFAPFYWASESMILGRIFRVFTLALTAMFFFRVVSCHTRNQFIALTATSLLLITPEFSWRATSMKVDIVLFFFEISSLLLFSLATSATSYHKRKYSELDLIFSLSIALAVVAFAIRPSGIYTLVIIISYYLFISIWLKRFTIFTRSTAIAFMGTAILLWIYFENIVLYQNPFFPIGGPWLSIFPNPVVYNEAWNIETLKSSHNLIFINKLVEFLYVPVHLGLGLETTLFDRFGFIPHPTAKNIAYGWANPLLSLIFLPILFVRNRRIMKLYIPLLFGYWLWFSSIHYSRVFFAWSIFLILVLAVIVSTKPSYKKFAMFISAALISLFTIYHSLYVFHRYPNTVGSFFSADSAQNSNYRALDRLSLLMGKGERGDFSIQDQQFIKDINATLETIDKPTIVTNLPILGYYNHIFFKKGKFLNYSEETELTKFDCILSLASHEPPKPLSFQRMFSSNNKEFWCDKVSS